MHFVHKSLAPSFLDSLKRFQVGKLVGTCPRFWKFDVSYTVVDSSDLDTPVSTWYKFVISAH